MVTANAVLVLTKSVTISPPVAVITPVGDQSIQNPAFNLDGSLSYHLDPTHHIVEFLWDFGNNGAPDFDHRHDASGPQVSNPGYTVVGTYTVTLRVKDDSVPPQFATTSINVKAIDTDIPPVAVPIPASRLPAYTSKPGVPITLDGSRSFDPDGTPITQYSWDFNGDGIYGDAFGVSPTFLKNTQYVGQVGLQVTSNGKQSVNTNTAFIDIYASSNNLFVSSITAPNVAAGDSADIIAVLNNDAASVQDFARVVVRFFNDNPYSTGVQIGDDYHVDLPIGAAATLKVHLDDLAGVTNVFVFVDANKHIPEWDEIDNIASVNIATSRVYGDLNGDLIIDTSDALLLANAIRKGSKDPKYDLNGDGKVDAADARWLQQHYTYPGGSHTPPPV